jgi:hypothetical protein
MSLNKVSVKAGLNPFVYRFRHAHGGGSGSIPLKKRLLLLRLILVPDLLMRGSRKYLHLHHRIVPLVW